MSLIYDNQAKYELDQTPVELAKRLIQLVPIEKGDVVYEPFKGEGSFYDNLPDYCIKHWTEIKYERDYRSFTEEVDWIITNPPFQIEKGKNCFFKLIEEFLPRVRKGICFIGNDKCISTFTPLRHKRMNEKGFYLSKITVYNVKKWYGRYYFFQITKRKSDDITFVEGSF